MNDLKKQGSVPLIMVISLIEQIANATSNNVIMDIVSSQNEPPQGFI